MYWSQEIAEDEQVGKAWMHNKEVRRVPKGEDEVLAILRALGFAVGKDAVGDETAEVQE